MDTAVGSDLRGLRLRKGLSLGTAAALSEVSKSALRAWENGTSVPRGPALARLLDALEAEPRLRGRLLHAADPVFARVELVRSTLGAPVDVGAVLRVMRRRRGMTQAGLARDLGVTQGTVSQWELGEARPTAETIHAIGFALGATVEETVALASAQGKGCADLPDDVEAVHATLPLTPVPGALQDVVSLGWEAELWRRAARDARWDACLIRVLADRANWLVGQERFDEIAVPANQAIRMAKTPEERGLASPAIAALADLDRHQGRGHVAAARMAGAWAAGLPVSLYRGWMLHQRGMCLARLGLGDEGAVAVTQGAEMTLGLMDAPHSIYLTLMLCEARLASDEPAKALAALGGRRERAISPSIYVRVEHANGQAATDAEMAYLRYWIGTEAWNPWERRRLERIERRQAKLTGGDPVPVSRVAVDDALGDRLWMAVLRESRG